MKNKLKKNIQHIDAKQLEEELKKIQKNPNQEIKGLRKSYYTLDKDEKDN